MKKLLAFLALLVCVLSAPQLANAAESYDDPGSLYFFDGSTSHAFSKDGSTYTYTVDATQNDVYGAINNANCNSWDACHAENVSYFPSSHPGNKGGDDGQGNLTVNSTETWGSLYLWGSYEKAAIKFSKGKKYVVTLTHANNKFSGKVTLDDAVSSADFTTNTNPTAVEFEATDRGKAKGNFTYVANEGDYNWYYDFTPTDAGNGWIHFKINVTYKDGTTKTFADNSAWCRVNWQVQN